MTTIGSYFAVFTLLCLLSATSFAANVSYDHRAILIDGKRRVLVSGSIHYPRSTPEMWPDLIQKSKDGGLDVIETYVFWNLHEPIRNKYDFEDRKDLVKFLKLVAQTGLYAHLRIGPYVCAEWNYGGFPLWLHFIPGIELRTDNEPYKKEMQRFTTYIVNLMKQEKLYASQGGPIILSQIENEYGNVQSGYGPGAQPYVKWAASMALSQNTGVPWVMCQQKDAPDPIIDTCNGFYCDQYAPKSPKKPKMWTENWTGWFLAFGGAVPYRPVEDLAFAVARFYQLGGTFQNYYMYHGGTNFGRTTGGPFISTSYDYDAPLDEYGQLQQPKWGHLKELHKAIKLCEGALVASEPATSSLGPNLDATVYKSGAGACSAAFLSNVGRDSAANVIFNGFTYNLPAWSVSILPDCKNVVLNTAQINTISTALSYAKVISLHKAGWSWINEPVGISKKSAFTHQGLLEQINVTADTSDYLWYSVSTNTDAGSEAVLSVESLGHVIHVFSNGKLAGSASGSSGNPKISMEFPITLTSGKNTIDLLSLTVGLQNYGVHFDLTGAGITGPVKLKNKNGSPIDLSSDKWTYQVGLQGEDSGLPQGASNNWISGSDLPTSQPLVWYKTNFDAPSGNNTVAIDFTGMGKGEAWVNENSIGRYWPAYTAPSGGCTNFCDYRGPYSSSKCLKNCGKPSQHLYHVPRSWLKPSGNILVLFEEIGGDPTQISFLTRQIATVCAKVSEAHPLPVDMWKVNSVKREISKPILSLQCPNAYQVISSIKFASFGNPVGSCRSFNHGKCSSAKALSIVQKACVGTKGCSIEVSRSMFDSSCPSLINSLAVEASCT